MKNTIYLQDNTRYELSQDGLSKKNSSGYIKVDETYTSDYFRKTLLEISSYLSLDNINALSKDKLIIFGNEFEFNNNQIFINVTGYDKLYIDTGNLIGNITKNNQKINIGSRFGDHFLRFLLSTTEGFLELEDMGTSPSGSSQIWVLIWLWKVLLKKAFLLGVPKSYQKRKKNFLC